MCNGKQAVGGTHTHTQVIQCASGSSTCNRFSPLTKQKVQSNAPLMDTPNATHNGRHMNAWLPGAVAHLAKDFPIGRTNMLLDDNAVFRAGATSADGHFRLCEGFRLAPLVRAFIGAKHAIVSNSSNCRCSINAVCLHNSQFARLLGFL